MLMDTVLDVTQQDYVGTAQASGKALVSLINEVLDQAKIQSGRLELEAVRFDPRAILDDVLSLFSGKSQEKGVEVITVFIFELSFINYFLLSNKLMGFVWPNLWEEQLAVYISDQVPEMLIGDPGRFRQIITNLMGNSIKVSTK